MTGPPGIQYRQATTAIYEWGQSELNVSLGILESSLDVQRGEIGQGGNDGIGMNPLGTIGSKRPTGYQSEGLWYLITHCSYI